MDSNPRIVVRLYNHNNYVVKKKTFNIRGMFRLQLLAAAKVLSLISTVVELYGNNVTKCVVELVNVHDPRMFCSLIKQYSPIPTEIIMKKEVVENVVGRSS